MPQYFLDHKRIDDFFIYLFMFCSFVQNQSQVYDEIYNMCPQIKYLYLFHTIFGFTDGPSVNIPPVETRISVGNTANIDCHAESRPLSNVTWSTGEKVVKVCSNSKSCPLVVGNVSVGQHINYTCSARNSFGNAENTIAFEGKGKFECIFHCTWFTVFRCRQFMMGLSS